MTTISKGVSVIICCYNSVARLVPTLQHLALQKVDPSINWEVIVVDNNSNDGTGDYAAFLWEKNESSTNLRIIREPKAGLNHARKCGYESANFDYLIYVDDDNSLAANYVETVYHIFESNKMIGMCGGQSTLLIDEAYPIPFWWNDFKHAFAVGVPATQNKNVDQIWGAGSAVRKTYLKELFDKGFDYLLSDRKGKSLSSGGDLELCFAIRLLGYKIYYDEALFLHHLIPQERITDAYLSRLYRAIGNAIPVLQAYQGILKYGYYNWVMELSRAFFIVFARIILLILFKLTFNKKSFYQHRIKLIADWITLKTDLKIPRKEYNTYCKQIQTYRNH